ncbi:hypothetical protein EV214_103167 [Marinisporobacter balticus]|uniref:Uncharacterized protein n=1 Tax=Marinisporobacter balticus TaxID=2018667 RepID=A0A4R2LIG2_9FIRM|nr:hypothetical protein EV214_103167 [Marinisporobacter balticus]
MKMYMPFNVELKFEEFCKKYALVAEKAENVIE